MRLEADGFEKEAERFRGSTAKILEHMKISLIAAMASNRVIGKNGFIPWKIPGEQHRFKEITLGHVVIMGKKTYESIGHPLPQRTNIVITSQNDYRVPGGFIAKDLQSALQMCPKDEDEVFICGERASTKKPWKLQTGSIYRYSAGKFPETSISLKSL